MRPAIRQSGGQRGFTLVELTIALALCGVVLLLAGRLLNGTLRRTADVTERVRAQQASQMALDTLVRDLRQAWTGDPDVPVMISLGPSSLSFYSPDRSTPVRLRRISYRRTGRLLERAEARSTDSGAAPWTFGPDSAFTTVLDGVAQGVLFVFEDADGAVTSTPSAVSAVQISLTVDRDPTREPGAQPYVTTAHLRVSR